MARIGDPRSRTMLFGGRGWLPRTVWLVAILLTSAVAAETVDDVTPVQVRAIFDEGTGWLSEEGARTTLGRIKRAGFNVYVVCVWHGMGVRYPSPVAVAEPGLSFEGEDPLARLVRMAHAEGIEVHPWFCVSLRQREFLGEFFDPGIAPLAFDLHKPEFRTFIVNLMLDVVQRYDVDGINLDYIRTQGICTSRSCQDDYRNQYGRDLLDDLTRRKWDGGLEDHVQAWQDQAVEAIVREVSSKGKTLKPRLIVSVDGYLRASSDPWPRNEEGRQELAWAGLGLVDVVFSMDYGLSPNMETFARARAEMATNALAVLLLGNYDCGNGGCRSRTGALVSDLVGRVVGRWPGGVAVYICSLLDESQIEALKLGPFRTPAIPDWKSAPRSGEPAPPSFFGVRKPR
ncbi:MAG: family 10 glycosylhydrolase [Syntrophobacteraceae bacterium]